MFWAYLWGIETLIMQSLSRGKGWVLSLPMRNWNANALNAPAVASTVLSLPMRNWNEFATQTPYRINEFWAYLWGIETGSKFSSFYFLLIQFWAYLWGIETTYDGNPQTDSSRFEPTYEELKPGRWYSDCQVEVQRFEPTYEELKHATVGEIVTAEIKFWAYLWGIETLILTTIVISIYWFWAYLWGIETFVRHAIASMGGKVLSLPMRNWNLMMARHMMCLL